MLEPVPQALPAPEPLAPTANTSDDYEVDLLIDPELFSYLPPPFVDLLKLTTLPAQS